MQLGSLVAYLSYLVQILMAVVMATFMISMIPRAGVAADRIQEVFDTIPSVAVAEQPITEVAEHGSLEFREVGFHYPGAEQPVLRNISFRVEAGQTTGIIGSTGGGKTTLMNLVPRLFDATSGSVMVGGIDVRDLDPTCSGAKLHTCPRSPISSRERWPRTSGSEAPTLDEEIWSALEVAQAAGFVQTMPRGGRERDHQGGTNVSGGQRQRLSIARAIGREARDIRLR